MRPPQKRRAVIGAIAALGTASLAGCEALCGQGAEDYPRLGELKALNVDDEPHTVHVSIELDGDLVYRKSKHVPSEEDGAVSALFSNYPAEPGPYEVFAWKDDQSRADAKKLDLAAFEATCVGVQVKIGTYGVETEEPQLSIYSTTNCPNSTTS